MALRDRIKVMVVDDMATSRGLLAQALDDFGVANVVTVSDGMAAIHAYRRTPVHLVIADYNMPNMDGLRLLHALRTNDKSKGVGFILMTGYADPEVFDSARQLGMNNFLQKPFTQKDVRACIEDVVGRL